VPQYILAVCWNSMFPCCNLVSEGSWVSPGLEGLQSRKVAKGGKR
jgi:hypothetical protein